MIADPAAAHPLIRRLADEDLDRIMEIERASYPFPWTRGIFADCIRVGYECRGLWSGRELIGYCILTHAAGEAHLLNLCIAPDRQRRGHGSLLLEHAVQLARRHDCGSMFLEVRPGNQAAIDLYRHRGFAIVGERRDYYRSAYGREDAVVMRLDLD
jgi:ribosomal-protein-alanine N-acetyltransferase